MNQGRINIIRKNPQKGLQWKYFRVMQLLDDANPWLPRLNLVRQIVSAPSFIYDEHQNPRPFLRVFLYSAYWLDQELFDTRVIRQRRCHSNLTGSQQAHMRLLDIGHILIEKGFPLEKNLIPKQSNPYNPTSNWAHVFLEQCLERHVFLKQCCLAHQSRVRQNIDKNVREKT